MTAKEWLINIGRLDREIETLREEMVRVRTLAESITARSGGTGGGNSGRVSDKVGDAAVRLADLQTKIANRIEVYACKREEAMTMIGMIKSSRYRELLIRRYFLRQSWRKIAMEMHMDQSTATRSHGRAMKEFRKIWNIAHKCTY